MTEPKIYYVNDEGEQPTASASSLIRQVENDLKAKKFAVCVIENISPVYVQELVPALLPNLCFFDNHAKHEDKKHFWKQASHWSWGPLFHIDEPPPSQFAHVDGMFEYHDLECGTSDLISSPNFFPRDCFKEDPYPIQSNTRISYCRVNPYLYLFLVDAPLDLRNSSRAKGSRARTTLRVRYSTSRGGLLLPQLFSQQTYCLLESFKSVFQHTWQFELLFRDIPDVLKVLPARAMLYMLSSSLWETNLRFLDSKIKQISLSDLRDPKDSTNNDLHDYHEDLGYLISLVIETVNWVPPTLSDDYRKLSVFNPKDSSTIRHPISNLTRIQDDAEKLQGFLFNTFQLLMSSISVRDSKLSIEQAKLSNEQAQLSAEQARRSAWLTQLATLYLPLSVLTGIFGMNLKEINDSHVPFWWSIVVLAILIACTAAVYFTLRGIEQRKQKQGAKRETRENV